MKMQTKRLFGILVVVAVLFTACDVRTQQDSSSSSNKGSSSNNTTNITIDPRMVGTWRCAGGNTWVFNADGTGCSRLDVRDNICRGDNFRFSSFSNKIIRHTWDRGAWVNDYVFSTDGRTFIIYGLAGNAWLEKQD
jgi:hypothetical protein